MLDPAYKTGQLFASTEMPYVNGLVQGLTGGPPARLAGTDQAWYAEETVNYWSDMIPTFTGSPAKVGGFWSGLTDWLGSGVQVVAWFVVGLVVLAIGLWTLTKE